MMRKCRIILILSLGVILMCVAADKYDCKDKIRALNSSYDSTGKIQKLSTQEQRFIATHYPITCDGYVLTIFRLSFGDKSPPTKNPVLLVHGMFQSSDRFLHQTRDKSLAYKLQDLGYDVWLFNARGNKYCRRNINMMSECDEKLHFFDYTYEEIGLLDLAATVDYILNVTLFKKIEFIGHSLGATYFLVLTSLRPDYNAFFDRAILLAPLAYHRFFRNTTVKQDLANFNSVELRNKDIVEIYPYKCIRSQDYKFQPNDCLGEERYKKICTYFDLQNVMGLNSDRNTKFDTRGGSIKQLAHLVQNILSGVFRRYQYPEAANNTKNYGEAISPEYNLSLITVPTTIYYSMTDQFVHYRDIKELAGKMINATAVSVAKTDFDHDDFVNSSDALYYVYTSIIRALPKEAGPKRPDKGDESHSTESGSGIKNVLIWAIIAVIGVTVCIFLCMAIVNWVTAPE